MNASQLIANRYKISDPEKDLLGQGGMGEVYRAIDTHTGERVAVKALNPAVVNRAPDFLERFRREGEALRQLNHPNIVKMIAAIEEGGRNYLIIEYVEGGSLQDLLAVQGSVPSNRVVEIALDLADALTRAHRLCIIHRDLKPANVLLAGDGTPRLTDFGIAHVTDCPQLTETGILIGTVDYLSPEACQGEPMDERADIWSFGIMLYEMLSGERPFKGKTLSAKLTAILTQPIPDLALLAPQTPDSLIELIYCMLAKDRQQRTPSMRLVGVELEAILKGREIPSRALLAHGESRFATPTPPSSTPKHNLPAQAIPFVGREAELNKLSQLLADPDVRLLTILGMGGMGKTRLALEIGASQLENFEHGVYFVSLAPLNSVDSIVPTLAEALTFLFRTRNEPKKELLDYLCPKKMLIIMDNFEHLLEGAGIISEILQAAPGIKILATSREGLNLQGEYLFHLNGMDIPDCMTLKGSVQDLSKAVSEYSAIKLFIQSARRAHPGFELEEDEIEYVAQICCRLGGIPLGIQLAAAWVKMLSLQEIVIEITQSLDFLATSFSDVPERQRSLKVIFDHAWNLLTKREQEVFQGLSVFRGGFTRDAAQQVTGASLHELLALVDRSMLHRLSVSAKSFQIGCRYEIHEFLRQYSAERLSAMPHAQTEVYNRHCEYHATFLQHHENGLTGARTAETLAAIRADIANIRAAWHWAVTHHKVEAIEQSLKGLSRFYLLTGPFQEGEMLIEAAVACVRTLISKGNKSREDFQIVLSNLLSEQTLFLNGRGKYNQAIKIAQEAIELAHANLAIVYEARSHLQWGRALWRQGDHKAARSHIQQALDLAHNAQLPQEEADSLRNLGNICYYQGDYAEAKVCYSQALNIYREVDDRRGEGATLNNLGIVSDCHGDYPEARTYYEQALQVKRQLGDRPGESTTLAGLSLLYHHMVDDKTAQKISQQASQIAQDLGDRHIQGYALTFLGHALTGLGRLVEAVDAYQQALALRRELGQPNLSTEPLAGLARIYLAQGDLLQAQVQVDEILGFLKSNTLNGTEEPFRVFLTCYQVLCTSQDPQKQGILNTAYNLLQEQAAKISDEQLRHSFLENVAVHREIVHTWELNQDC